ncbi:MAG: AraC family transcriptional regulator [Aliidongia sp.]
MLEALDGTRARAGTAAQKSGLAPWQLQRAKAFFATRLEEKIDFNEIAAVCRLSRSHFGRAFRCSTGLPPHRWVMERRVEMAKSLLADSNLPLAEIAVASGFNDQSHLTRVFSRAEGETPGAWRRQRTVGHESLGMLPRPSPSRIPAASAR